MLRTSILLMLVISCSACNRQNPPPPMIAAEPTSDQPTSAPSTSTPSNPVPDTPVSPTPNPSTQNPSNPNPSTPKPSPQDPSAHPQPQLPMPQDPPKKQEGIAWDFPKDEGGNLLKKLLEPRAPTLFKDADKSRYVERPIPTALAAPSIIKPSVNHPLLTKQGPPRIEPMPHSLPMPFPNSATPLDPLLPVRSPFPTAPLIDAKANDPSAPAPLPSLARPEPNRAPIYDPTPEYTANRVISVVLPLRTATSPYIRITLPEPTETLIPKTPTVPNDNTLPSFVPPPLPARPQ
jgi:hypothetical protein